MEGSTSEGTLSVFEDEILQFNSDKDSICGEDVGICMLVNCILDK